MILKNDKLISQLINSSHIGILVVDKNRNNIFVNNRLSEMFGYTIPTLLSSTAEILHVNHETFLNFGKLAFNAVLNGTPLGLDYEFKKSDGSLFWIHISGEPIKENNEVLWTLVDVTDRVLAQEELLRQKEDQAILLSLFDKGEASLFKWNNDEQWSIQYASKNVENLTGYTHHEFMGKFITYASLIHQDDIPRVLQEVQEAIKSNANFFKHDPYRIISKDGSIKWVLDQTVTQKDTEGNITHFIGYINDITEEKLQQQQIHYQTQIIEQHSIYLQSIIDGIDDPIMVIREDYTIPLMNKSVKNSIDISYIADPDSPKCYEVSHRRSTPCDGDDHPCPLKNVCDTQKHISVVHNHKHDGVDHFVELSASPLFDAENNFLGIIESARDITQDLEVQKILQEQKSELLHQAHHDALTGLPNRTLFNDRLSQAIEKAKRNNTKVAIFFIDLDHFKEINDSMGHNVGDEVLKSVTQRLQRSVRAQDTIARLGGDEFTVIVEDFLDIHNLSSIANKVLKSLSNVIELEDIPLYVSSSIGISIYPEDGDTATNLLKFADSAMYKAKAEGRNNYQFYDLSMTEQAFERVVMEANLREALSHNHFVVYYQPQTNAITNKLCGMEALVRWRHPNLGLIAPSKFIPLAESTGMIVELDREVMKMAMEQFAHWYAQGLNPGKLAINLSVKQLEQQDFLPYLKTLLDETRCQADWIELEVTESKMMNNPEKAIAILKQINALGINLAIDDFGTGYSSLAYLKRLPIHKLKIDQSFVRDLPSDEEDAAISKAIIALAKSLNLDVLSEGVETLEQKEFLVEHGCDIIQGYFYSKPLPREDMERYLQGQF